MAKFVDTLTPRISQTFSVNFETINSTNGEVPFPFAVIVGLFAPDTVVKQTSGASPPSACRRW